MAILLILAPTVNRILPGMNSNEKNMAKRYKNILGQFEIIFDEIDLKPSKTPSDAPAIWQTQMDLL